MNDARPQPFPWGAALHFGLGLLRLAPAAFWALTPRELSVLAGGARPAGGPDRNQLNELMKRWPDVQAAGKEA